MKTDDFRRRPWRAHTLLAGIPLRTLERIDLQGRRNGMTIEEIGAITGFSGEKAMQFGPVTQFLFWLRGLIGNRSRAAGRLMIGAKKGGFAALGVILLVRRAGRSWKKSVVLGGSASSAITRRCIVVLPGQIVR